MNRHRSLLSSAVALLSTTVRGGGQEDPTSPRRRTAPAHLVGRPGRHRTFPNISAGLILLAIAGPVSAQSAARKCPQGQTSIGTCANPLALHAAQQRAVVFTQSKISYLGLPIFAPSDSYVDAARDRESLRLGIDQPVPTTTNTGAATIPPGTFIRLPTNTSPTQLQITEPYTIVPGGIRIR